MRFFCFGNHLSRVVYRSLRSSLWLLLLECTAIASQLKITDPTSRQRGRPTSTNPQLYQNNQREKEKNLSRVPDVCLIQRQTGRLTVGRNITLTLTLTSITVFFCRTYTIPKLSPWSESASELYQPSDSRLSAK
jgi:hypothetical protein